VQLRYPAVADRRDDLHGHVRRLTGPVVLDDLAVVRPPRRANSTSEARFAAASRSTRSATSSARRSASISTIRASASAVSSAAAAERSAASADRVESLADTSAASAERGVLALTWHLHRHDGRSYVVTASSTTPTTHSTASPAPSSSPTPSP
jgi:hypothetical protein